MCLRDDLGGEVQPFAEVVEALRGEGVVVPMVVVLGDLWSRIERLQGIPLP